MNSGEKTKTERIEFRKGTMEDVSELSALYDALNLYLETHENYPGWKKGVYPIRKDAEQGILEKTLWVAVKHGRIIGTVILRQEPESGYELADWGEVSDYKDIFVVYTLAVHPDYLGQGIGKEIMRFILRHAAEMGRKEIRLDVYEKNSPAIMLYENMGFRYVDTVDLGYGKYGLDYFRLYQKSI